MSEVANRVPDRENQRDPKHREEEQAQPVPGGGRFESGISRYEPGESGRKFGARDVLGRLGREHAAVRRLCSPEEIEAASHRCGEKGRAAVAANRHGGCAGVAQPKSRELRAVGMAAGDNDDAGHEEPAAAADRSRDDPVGARCQPPST